MPVVDSDAIENETAARARSGILFLLQLLQQFL